MRYTIPPFIPPPPRWSDYRPWGEAVYAAALTRWEERKRTVEAYWRNEEKREQS